MHNCLMMLVATLVILVGLSACQGSQPEQPAREGTQMELELTSGACQTGNTIPRQSPVMGKMPLLPVLVRTASQLGKFGPDL